jgi:hypothetical protein
VNDIAHTNFLETFKIIVTKNWFAVNTACPLLSLRMREAKLPLPHYAFTAGTGTQLLTLSDMTDNTIRGLTCAFP